MEAISVTVEGGNVRVRCPYLPDFPALARSIGGDYRGGIWFFDLRDEGRARTLLREVFGTDGTPVRTVDVRISLDKFKINYQTNPLWMFGRMIAERRYRDGAVRLGPGVVLVEGGFPSRGGSQKYPELDPHDGTILEVRDVPFEHKDLAHAGVILLEEATDVLEGDDLVAELRALALEYYDAMKGEYEGAKEPSERWAAMDAELRARLRRVGVEVPEQSA